ncbi:hypothetical protein [Phenylobacterium aquaticum]|uniref:hypothetical protein n=1 Tax=Phenylobacterium aquaticum TaxID=1763816 RepID=UPI0026F02BF6|nr:hypothetical protein [Phenylobacterium aquaticum]
MLFLLNDTILDFDATGMAPYAVTNHVHGLSLDQVIDLISEAFVRNPSLPQSAPTAASKAAIMLVLKQPQINAALFLPTILPEGGVRYTARFAALDPPVIYDLKGMQDQGRLTPGVVNACVWEAVTPDQVAAAA